tara:strand:- start:8216 stop:9142 length:927 start_codon:yes stop_codon:yes gene_type:complete
MIRLRSGAAYRSDKKVKHKDLALILLVNILWSSNFLAAKVGLEEFPPLFFTATRFFIVVLVLLPFISLPHGNWRKIILVGIIMGVLHYWLMFWGLSIAPDISSVAIINQTFIPFSTILAVLFLKERIGWQRSFAIFLAFAGVMVIGFDPVIFANLLSPVLVLVASFLVALNMVIVRTMQGVSAVNLTFWTSAIGVVPLFLLSLVIEEGHMTVIRTAGWEQWTAVAYSAVGATVVGHGLANYLIKRYPVSTVAPYYLLVPVLAVLIGVVFWGDVLTPELITGGLMVMAGVSIITFRSTHKKKIKATDDA